MNYDEILKKVNPIYFSAKGCLRLLEAAGDSDIVNFYNDIDKEQLTELDNEPITKSRVISLEARYHMWNVIAKETNCQNIVDLPCGYMPHSLITARLNKNYYGFDLPIVVDELSGIADKYLNDGEKSLVQYHGVDATNYSSMRDALKNVDGNICIITDGLLGYFDRADLKVVCENIHRLLREFGGCWYTADAYFNELMGITYAVLTGENQDSMMNATERGSMKVSDSANVTRIFLTGTHAERRQFIEECGFSIKSFRYPDKLHVIPSLKDNPALMERLLSAYSDIEGWILTADNTESAEKLGSDIPFAQEFDVKGNVLEIRIRGRLDTITAPKFLQKYEEQQADSFTEIHIDAAELGYISYAGLRVFKIICENLADTNLFKVSNANDEVGKILKENGYTIK